LAKSLVPELGDRELHLLDQQFADADFGLGIARFGLRFQARELCGDHYRLEGGDIVGEKISSGLSTSPDWTGLGFIAHLLGSLRKKPYGHFEK
jgi:hypothetical protein